MGTPSPAESSPTASSSPATSSRTSTTEGSSKLVVLEVARRSFGGRHGLGGHLEVATVSEAIQKLSTSSLSLFSSILVSRFPVSNDERIRRSNFLLVGLVYCNCK